MALPRLPFELFPDSGRIFVPRYFNGVWAIQNLPEFVCWVKAVNKITGKALDFLWVIRFLLVGSLPWLDRMVRVGYVCLFPGPA